MRSRSLLAVIPLLLAAGVAACGDDGGSGSTSSTSGAAPSTSTASTSTASTTTGLSTQSAIAGAPWGDNVGITFNTDGTFTFQSDGIPNHPRDAKYLVPTGGQPGAVPQSLDDVQEMNDPTSEQDYSFTIPLVPTYSDTTTPTSGGSIGVIVSGAVLFNPYEGDGTTVAIANNLTDASGVSFIDACNGHPGPGGAYHYHAEPVCITDTLDVAGEHSKLIGIAFDGFPIYGSQGTDGSVPTGLDECSGEFGPTPEFPQGIYHYHLLTTAPFSIPCFHGTVDASLVRHLHG